MFFCFKWICLIFFFPPFFLLRVVGLRFGDISGSSSLWQYKIRGTRSKTGIAKCEVRLEKTKKNNKNKLLIFSYISGPTNTIFLVLNRFPKNQKNPFPRRSLEIRISRLRENARIPQGGGRSPPPGGSSAFFKQHSRNSNFEWSPWKGIFLIFWKCVQNQKSCILQQSYYSYSKKWAWD